jgi:hypothetical protein
MISTTTSIPNLCEFMLHVAKRKLKLQPLCAPALRRQIAGDLDNPYDMADYRNLDIKLFIEDFFEHYGTNPPFEHIEKIAIFQPHENLELVTTYLKNLSSNNSDMFMNLSRL